MPGAADSISSRTVLPVWLLFLPLIAVAIACEATPSPVQIGKPKPTDGNGSTAPREKPIAMPQVTAQISKAKLNWKDRQQTFVITLTNNGDKQEIVHAVVYGVNNDTNPPRRGISPPTATDWFGIINSRDGVLTAADVERSWKAAGFLSARGNRLRRTWDEKVDAGATIEVQAAHDLDEKSPHPQWKGKPLAAVPYTEYHLWLFSSDGFCFFEERVGAFGPLPRDTKPETKKPDTKLDTKKVVDTRPTPDPRPAFPPEPKVSAKEEAQAGTELKLATTYLEMNRRQDAKDKLNLILKKFPDSEAAKKARDMLDRIQ